LRRLDAIEQNQAAQQQELDTAITKLAEAHNAPNAQSGARPPCTPCRNDAGVGGGHFHTTAHKLEFPKFNGSDDPLPWLNRCERYFHERQTPEHQRVAFAAFYLLDNAQLWFHRMELNGSRPTWPQFVQLVNTQFGMPFTDSAIGELAMLQHTGTVDDYSKRFIALSCRDTSLSKPQQIQLYIMGLGDPLWTDVALQQSTSLDNAVIFARAYEQRNASRDAAVVQLARSSSRFTGRSTGAPTPTASSATLAPSLGSINKPESNAICLSPSKIAQRRKDSKCFKCN
jgi:hypothetical protein